MSYFQNTGNIIADIRQTHRVNCQQ